MFGCELLHRRKITNEDESGHLGAFKSLPDREKRGTACVIWFGRDCYHILVLIIRKLYRTRLGFERLLFGDRFGPEFEGRTPI